MIRAIFISLFIGLILVKPVAQFSWEIWYSVNIEYVTEELCENNDEPELECNGKCYLMKQLNKVEAESNEQPTPEQPVRPYKVKEEQFYAIEPRCCSNIVELVGDEKPIDSYSLNQTEKVTIDIFHPPQLLS